MFSPFAFGTLGGVPVTGAPVAISGPTYGAPFSEGAFECREWQLYEHRGARYFESALGQDRTTFLFPAFAANVAATLLPLAFVARSFGRWTPLMAVPVLVIVATVARGRLRIAADTIDDTAGFRTVLLVAWLGTIASTAALSYVWHKLRQRRATAAASRADGSG